MIDKIAAAPICWGVVPSPDWGEQLRPERVFTEMRQLGLDATEVFSSGWIPEDEGAARALLDDWGMRVTGGFLSAVLHENPETWQSEFVAACHRFRALGADVVVLAAVEGPVPFKRRASLTTAEWNQLVTSLESAVEIAAERDLLLTLHPHLNSAVETHEDVERVLDCASVSLCLDTGHLLAAGVNPAALARRAGDRVGYVHLKDVDPTVVAQYRDGQMGLRDAIRGNMFQPLGRGVLDVSGVVGGLRDAGYDGWYVIEQDVMLNVVPAPGTGPVQDVKESLRVLTDLA